MGVWHPGLVTDGEVRRSRRGFGYDLGVNVLANLFTAAVIYLGAVYRGYIAKDPDLVAVSIAVIMVALVAVAASLLSRLVEREAARPPQPAEEPVAEERMAARTESGARKN